MTNYERRQIDEYAKDTRNALYWVGGLLLMRIAAMLLMGQWLLNLDATVRILNERIERDERAYLSIRGNAVFAKQLATRNYERITKLDRYGEINAPLIYEPGDPAAAQPLHTEKTNEQN